MKSFCASLLMLLISLILTGLLVWAIGESPWTVYKVLFSSCFGSATAIGYTIFYATPLIFTGLSVALAFQTGLFNIGCEGQLNIGAFCATLVGLYAPVATSHPYGWLALGLAAAFVGGAVWGLIPGLLKAFRGSHEVINTIMLNAIAVALVSYLTLYHFRDPQTQTIETPKIAEALQVPGLSRIFPLPETSPANFSFFLALLAAAGTYILLWKTRLGLTLRAVGRNEVAARCAGISVKKNLVLIMVIAGGLAGLVGANDILGYAHRFKDGFSPGYGFLGIAVALLGRNHPAGVILSALLFGALQNASISLELDTDKITRDLVGVIEGIILIAAASDAYFRSKFSRRKQ